MDLNSNRILLKNIHEQRLIASITKIMTAIVAIEYGNLDDSYEVEMKYLKHMVVLYILK